MQHIKSRNKERDDEINKKFLFMGWTVIRFWGDEIQKHPDECVKVIEEAIFDIIMQSDASMDVCPNIRKHPDHTM